MAFGKLIVEVVLIHVILLFSVSTQVTKQNYTLGFLVPYSSTVSSSEFPGHFNSDRYAQAILVALNDVKNDTSLLPNVNLKWVLNDTLCDKLLAIRQQAWQRRFGVDVFFGPACHCVTAGRKAAAFDKPMMSYRCLDELSSNRREFPTMARTSVSDEHITPPLIALLKHFKWKRVAIVTSAVKKWTMIETHVKDELKKANITVALASTIVKPMHVEPLNKDIRRILPDIRKNARIVILLMEHADTVEFMLNAYDDYVKTGEYVFISFNLNPGTNYHKVKMKWHFSSYTGLDNLKNYMKSFASLLIISVRPYKSKRYTKFQEEVKRLSLEEPFKTDAYNGCGRFADRTKEKCARWKNNTKTGESRCIKYVNQTKPHCLYWKHFLVPPSHAAYLYDAIVQYAYALNQTLAKNLPADGLNIIDQLKGHTFDSISGYKLTFNENADVIFNFTLLDQRLADDKTHCEGTEGPCKIMETMAEFWPDPKNVGRQIYKQIVSQKTWYKRGTKVPPDTPPCGFLNEHCTVVEKTDTHNSIKIVVGVSIPFALLLLLLLFIVCRRRRRILNQKARNGSTMLIEQ